MALSWLGFVMAPTLQLGDLQPTNTVVVTGLSSVYPNAESGTAHQGAEIYRAEGCGDCHTQQVRPRQQGADILRGWGVRRSTAYDYLYDQPVMLGSVRVGPDLANAGARMDYSTVLLRLYDPRAVVPGSIMPSYRFLFDKHPVDGRPAPDALRLTGDLAPAPGFEIVPTPAARALATYIVSLRQKDYLFEAPPPFRATTPTNAASAMATNAPSAASTNAVPVK